MFNVEQIRKDFPVLSVEAHPGVPLVYLDSAASSQKPTAVIEAMDTYYREYNSNVHRGIHALSEKATEMYEEARKKVAAFINAEPEEIIFTRNATESVNLVAYSWGRANLLKGQNVLITEMEHHANIVPWQMACEATGATLNYVPFNEDGTLDLSQPLLNPRTKMVAFTAVSNVFGTVNPVKLLTDAAHAVGAKVLVDAAQAVPHEPVDVKAWDCDFAVFSGHKMAAPTGVGVLYGKRELLEAMPPFMGGGDMIRRVTMEKSTWNELPHKFEAGTPAIAEGIGLGAAVDYLTAIGMENIHAHEQAITAYAMAQLADVPGLTMLGLSAEQSEQRGGLVAFTMDGAHPHDIAQILDEDGIAVRAGHHCAMPLHKKLGLAASARASFYIHTTTAEIDKLVAGLHRVREVMRL